MVGDRTGRARRLRRDQTGAERLLWSRLRNRQLGGFKFKRQLPVGRYIADFACIESRVIVEVDGGQHAEQVQYDTERTLVLEQAGFEVLRFWNPQVLEELEGVLEEILAALTVARH